MERWQSVVKDQCVQRFDERKSRIKHQQLLGKLRQNAMEIDNRCKPKPELKKQHDHLLDVS